jgi:uncharacterized protein YecT (DUF1311 family)
MDTLLIQLGGMHGGVLAAIGGLLLVSIACPSLPATWIERRSYWKRFGGFVGAMALGAVVAGTQFAPRDTMPFAALRNRGDSQAPALQTSGRTGDGFDCGRYLSRPRDERTAQRDLLCTVESARIADREMSGLFRLWRNTTPGTDYRAITATQLGWLEQRHARCPAVWQDTEDPGRKQRFGVCLEAATRQRTAATAAVDHNR